MADPARSPCRAPADRAGLRLLGLQGSPVEHFGTSLTAVGWVFSPAIVTLGLSAALFGTRDERAGPRMAMLVTVGCWSSGFLVGALGIATSQLWRLWVVLSCTVTAGIGILENAADMIQDFFCAGGESSVASAAGFVGLLSPPTWVVASCDRACPT